MDLKNVFTSVSKKLLLEFDATGEIPHPGMMGTAREGALKKFLEQKMPNKYGLGSGIVVNYAQEASKQCDLVISDRLNATPFVDENDVRIHPLDNVYGIIEIKSKLSKTKLVEALENIKRLKSLYIKEGHEYQVGDFVTIGGMKPRPFGIIFAYALDRNSLDSIRQNLIEWEAENDREVWPNLIVVLNVGIISHWEEQEELLSSEKILSAKINIGLAFREDTLFHFYKRLLELCSRMVLPVVQLEKYFNPSSRVGSFIVKRHDLFCKIEDQNSKRKLSDDFINKIVSWSRNKGKVGYETVLRKQLGEKTDLKFAKEQLGSEVYFYDPEDLPSGEDCGAKIEKDEQGRPSLTTERRSNIQMHYIIVNNESYFFSMDYLVDGDMEDIE